MNVPLVNLKEALKPSRGLDLIDPHSSYTIKLNAFSYLWTWAHQPLLADLSLRGRPGQQAPGRLEAQREAAPAPPPLSLTRSAGPHGGWWSEPAGLGAAGRSSCSR